MKILVTLSILVFSITGLAQNNCQPMPGVQLANPRCAQGPTDRQTDTARAGNAIEWTFPKPDQVTITKEGRTYSILAEEVFAEKTRVGDQKQVEAALVYFTPRIVATFELAHISKPNEVPNVDAFLAFTAVGLTIEQTGLPDLINKGPLFDMEFFFFKIRSGRVVAAHVSADRKFVIVLPVPASK